MMWNNTNGTRIWVQDGANSCCQTPYTYQNGVPVNTGMNPNAPSIARISQVSNRSGAVILTPRQLVALQAQVQAGASGLNSSFGLTEQAGGGSGLVTTSVASSPSGMLSSTYTIILDNTGLGSTADVRYLGDWAQSWILKNPPPAPSPGMTIGGSYGVNSLSHATQRTLAAAWAVASIKATASNVDFFDGSNMAYIDTSPNGSNPTFQQFSLSDLVQNDQFNATIQNVTEPMIFDGISALQISVPANRKVTLNFNIVSEGRGQLMRNTSSR